MISSKYVPALCVLMVFPLAPTFIHSYLKATVVDGRALSTALPSIEGYTTATTVRGSDWGRQNFNSDDWLERRYVSPTDDIVLTVVRSYDLKTLYHHPELACAYGVPFDRQYSARFPQHPEIPMRVLQTSVGQPAAAFYALQYDDTFVEQPITFQLQTAATLLFSARKPMTLFFVIDRAVGDTPDLNNLRAVSVLFAAIERFGGTPPR